MNASDEWTISDHLLSELTTGYSTPVSTLFISRREAIEKERRTLLKGALFGITFTVVVLTAIGSADYILQAFCSFLSIPCIRAYSRYRELTNELRDLPEEETPSIEVLPIEMFDHYCTKS